MSPSYQYATFIIFLESVFKMADTASTSRGTPLRLQDTKANTGFPPHIAEILNPGSKIACKEFLCRLVHVCMVEVGFIPVIEGNEEFTTEELSQSQFSESVPTLVRRLRRILEKTGSLQSVAYKALAMEQFAPPEEEPSSIDDEGMSGSDPLDDSLEKKPTANIPVAGKDSGDGSSGSIMESEASSVQSMGDDYLLSVPSNASVMQWRKAYSGTISVATIYDGGEMIIIATGPGFHKNTQVSIFQYIHTRNMVLPTATMEEYLRVYNFSPQLFVNDVKRRFCYLVMDAVDGLSFDIRSLSWLPREIIVEIAKRCSPVQLFRLRATCPKIREALSKSNMCLWRFLLRRDFPQYNLSNLSYGPCERFHDKYCDLCKFTFRRPLRRTLAHSRMIFPTYLSNNFRLNWM